MKLKTLVSDLSSALRLAIDAFLPLLLITLVVCAVMLAIMQLNPLYLVSVASLLFHGGFLLVPIWMLLGLAFFILMIEIFHHQSVRRGEPDVRFRWIPRKSLVVSTLVTSLFLIFLMFTISLILSAVLSLFLPALMSATGAGGGGGFGSLFILLTVWQLIAIIITSYVISRIGLLPTISRRWDIGFGEAWRHQTVEFDPGFPKVRNRFFLAILALGVIQGVVGYVISQVLGSSGLPVPVRMLATTVVSMIFLGLYFGLMAHLVHTHEPPAQDEGTAETGPVTEGSPG